MLMKLLWWLAKPIVSAILGLLPAAPDPVNITVPWPAWLPFWPVAAVLTMVLVAGGLALLLRFLRWVYGLIPIIQ